MKRIAVLILIGILLVCSFTASTVHATVAVETAKSGPYAGAGTTGPFTYAFKIWTASDLKVVQTTALGVASTLVLNVDYTVTGVGLTAGGTVTLTTALPVGETLTLIRNMPYLQEQNWGTISTTSLNNVADKLEHQIQQLLESSERSFQVPYDIALASKYLRPSAGKLIGWDAAGTGLYNWPTTTLSVPTIDHIGNHSDDLATAITDIGASNQLLLIHKAITLTGTTTVPPNIQLWIVEGGSINLNGQVLTINGPLDAGTYQIFSGTGSVVLGHSATHVLASWWGASTSASASVNTVAIQAAIDAGAAAAIPVQLGSGTYSFTALSLPKKCNLSGVPVVGSLGAVGYGTKLQHVPVTPGDTAIYTDNDPDNFTLGGIELSNMAIIADASGNSGIGLSYVSVLGGRINNIAVAGGFSVAGVVIYGLQDCRIDNLKVSNSAATLLMPIAVHFANTAMSTSTIISNLYVGGKYTYAEGGGITDAIVADSGSLLDLLFVRPIIESINNNAWVIHRYNQADIVHPYTENIPNRASTTYAAFRVGMETDAGSYIARTVVNLYGGRLAGYNGANGASRLIICNYINQMNVIGPLLRGMAAIIDYESGGSAYGTVTFSGVSDINDTLAFGTVDTPQNIVWGSNNIVHTDAMPTAHRQMGTWANKPVAWLSKGLSYFATDHETNGAPRWWNGTAWVDSTGTVKP